jgi:hypothetical protein
VTTTTLMGIGGAAWLGPGAAKAARTPKNRAAAARLDGMRYGSEERCVLPSGKPPSAMRAACYHVRGIGSHPEGVIGIPPHLGMDSIPPMPHNAK